MHVPWSHWVKKKESWYNALFILKNASIKAQQTNGMVANALEFYHLALNINF